MFFTLVHVKAVAANDDEINKEDNIIRRLHNYGGIVSINVLIKSQLFNTEEKEGINMKDVGVTQCLTPAKAAARKGSGYSLQSFCHQSSR